MTNFLSFGEPSAGRFPKSMVVLEEAIVKVSVGFWSCLSLVEAGRDVAFINKVLGADLCNVHINHVGVVTIQLKKFVFVV